MAARIVGHGMTRVGKLGLPPSTLMQTAIEHALRSAMLRVADLDGLIAVPSLAAPRFMEAHALATQLGMVPGAPERSSDAPALFVRVSAPQFELAPLRSNRA